MSISTEVIIAIVFARLRRPTEDAEMRPLAISYFPAIYPDSTKHFFRNFHDTRAGGPWPPSHFNVAGGPTIPGTLRTQVSWRLRLRTLSSHSR
ncbi:hypothetical protein CGCSCA4_v008076 [Colletotrichum siamense]|uniref:Uncharacterized protein n=1 Tax=Colletotrichum siamense TaxID=690259 RepID=A0A9P5ETR0_COLSI|nr:hypothetical protein CGCSCA4_v008076 [Colletotrichum siamense]KAF4859167.1 hypothetical protein CGCSCA2_v006580 [Colletotrichum siamense]